jgi:hypothetical protein
VTHYQLAAVSLIGSFFDVLGALYLAYDILGGKHGPLRALTRGVTYGLIFGVPYGAVLGLPFGIAAGVAHGITLAFELTRAAKQLRPYPLRYEFLFSVIRGIGFGIGATYLHGREFGIYFGVLATVGQCAAYRIGIRPALDYGPRRAPRISPMQIAAAVLRTFGYLAAGYISAVAARHGMHALMLGVETGLSIGIVTAAANALMPFIEWAADTIPDRRLGVLGVVLILIGFTLQSVQYWLILLDIPVN